MINRLPLSWLHLHRQTTFYTGFFFTFKFVQTTFFSHSFIITDHKRTFMCPFKGFVTPNPRPKHTLSYMNKFRSLFHRILTVLLDCDLSFWIEKKRIAARRLKSRHPTGSAFQTIVLCYCLISSYKKNWGRRKKDHVRCIIYLCQELSSVFGGIEYEIHILMLIKTDSSLLCLPVVHRVPKHSYLFKQFNS